MTDRPSILVTSSLGYGGDLLYWTPILQALDQGHPLLILSAANEPQIFPMGNVEIAKITAQKLRFGRRTQSYDRDVLIPGFFQLWRTLRRLRPATIIVSEFTPISLMAVLYATVARSIRLIQLVESDPTVRGQFQLPIWKRVMRRVALRSADHVLTNNQGGRDHVRSLGVESGRITVAPYVSSAVVNQSDRRPAETSHPHAEPERLRLLVVGQVTARKGAGELVQALAAAPDNASLEVRWVGAGPLLERMRAETATGGLPIDFAGPSSYEAMSTHYQWADVFLIPTLHDYRSLVGFEALAHGLPIIHSTFDGAAEEVTKPDVNGIWYNPRQPDALWSAIQVLRDPTTRSAFAEQSLVLAGWYTPDVCAATLAAALDHQ